MPNEPSISVREWIKWKPEQESEPTSTLVLTSSSKQFVDVRILKPTQPGEPELPNEGGPMSRLDWAFAGTSSSTLLPPKSSHGSPTSHSKWTHWIDSLHVDTTGVTDEGDMFPEEDGIHVLEKGSMVNPATGRLTSYEEYWADLEVERVDGKRWSVVLIVDDELDAADGKKLQVKGMIVRVGQFCQGIIRVGEELALERWSFIESGEKWEGNVGETIEAKAGPETSGEQQMVEAKEGKWERVARLGRIFMPCSIAFRPEAVDVGSKITYGDYKWQVKEVFEW